MAQRQDAGGEEDGAAAWAAAGPDPGASAPRHERAGRLAAAIAELPEPMREVVVRRALDRASWEEVAVALGKTSATVRVTWARALKRLQESLDAGAAPGSEEHHGEPRDT